RTTNPSSTRWSSRRRKSTRRRRRSPRATARRRAEEESASPVRRGRRREAPEGEGRSKVLCVAFPLLDPSPYDGGGGGRMSLAAEKSASGNVIDVANIEVIYNHVILVLKGVSLSVPDGAIVALLGANGAGKSTT